MCGNINLHLTWYPIKITKKPSLGFIKRYFEMYILTLKHISETRKFSG